MDTRPIGIFDSGVGGLTVVKTLLQTLPGENFVYFGDTAHVPYGSKTREQLFQYAHKILSFMIKKDVKAILVACNTHSSVTLPTLEKQCPVPILGVVKPGSRAAARTCKNGRIGIIATQATFNSHAYSININKINQLLQVYETACPRLVPLIESGQLSGEETHSIVSEYISPLLKKDIDTLVLGCTHYPFLEELISSVTGSSITLIDPAMETVEELSIIMNKNNIANTNGVSKIKEFYVSGNDESLYNVGKLLLGDLIQKVDKVNLD